VHGYGKHFARVNENLPLRLRRASFRSSTHVPGLCKQNGFEIPGTIRNNQSKSSKKKNKSSCSSRVRIDFAQTVLIDFN
jgi:hypothetical protein